MGSFSKNFALAVVVLDIFAIVYFGGNYITTGHLTAPAAHAEEEVAVEANAPKAEATPEITIADLIGDATKGAKIAAKCKACHTFDKGGKNKVGPNLWNTFNAAAGSQEGFKYSPAMLAKATEIVWDEQHLDGYLTNPRQYVKGTKMAFGGIKNPQERADLVAWLKTLQD